VAEEVQVSLKDVLNELGEGKSPGFTIGRPWRISEEDPQRFIQQSPDIKEDRM